MGLSISLDQVHVATPCPVPWNEMRGDDRVRYCDRCQFNVYHLSGMTRAEAEQLINEKEGRLCVGYYQRADGTILTRDCPVGLRLARAAASRVVGLAGTVCCALLLLLAWIEKAGGSTRFVELRLLEPFRSIQTWLTTAPAVRGQMVVGGIVLPPRLPRPANGAIRPPSSSESSAAESGPKP